MQRRTLLLFTLFVVTAWFYSSFTAEPTKIMAKGHKEQAQLLLEAEQSLSQPPSAESVTDRG